MNIAIDVRSLYWKRSGMARYLDNLLKNLLLIDKENKYFLYSNTPIDESKYLAINSNIIFRCSSKGLIVYKQILTPVWIRRDRINVFFSPSPEIPFFKMCKYISTIHDLAYEIFPEWNSAAVKLYAKLKLFRVSANLSDKIISVSENTKQDIIKFYKIKREDKINVIYLASEEFSGASEELINDFKKKYKIIGNYIFYLDTVRVKNTLYAFADFVKSYDCDMRLVILGKLKNADCNIQEEITKLGLEANIIHIQDCISDAELSALYSGAELFLFPSLYEGFGLPPLEAMACGTPVITSNISSIPEVVGDAALLIDPYSIEDILSAITSLIDDKKLKNDLIAKGFERVKRFTWESTARQTYNLIQTMN